jgi:hypothetical protein
MKRLRSLCAANALLFVLWVSALAGDMHTGAVPPPPPPPSAMSARIEAGEISTGATEMPAEFNSLVTEIVLSLWQLLSVF